MKTQPTTNPVTKSTENNKLESFHQFSGQEKTELKRLVAEGKTVRDISLTLNRSESTVKRWAVRLGVREKRKNTPWSQEDVDILAHGIKHGMPIPTIAMTLNRTPGAVATYATERYKNWKILRVPETHEEETLPEPEPKNAIFTATSSDLYVQWCKAMRHYAQTEHSGLATRSQDRRNRSR